MKRATLPPVEKPNTDVIQGTLDLLILKTLSLEADGSRRRAAAARESIR